MSFALFLMVFEPPRLQSKAFSDEEEVERLKGSLQQIQMASQVAKSLASEALELVRSHDEAFLGPKL